MTEEERLAKNERIRTKGKLTREKRKSQVCRVYRVKIDVSHLNEQQKLHLKMLFVEAKWLYNDALTFINNDHDINEYDTKTRIVHGLDKDRQPVTHELEYLSAQMRQGVISGIKANMKGLAALRDHNRKTGRLRYKSECRSINLTQYVHTHRFYDEYHIGLQGFRGRIKINGANQFWNIPGLELADAKLLNLPDGYYLAITTFQDKGGEQKKYKSPVGIDFGIKTSITTSEGKKYHVMIGEGERLKKIQRQMMRRKKGSSNRYKAKKLLRLEYQKLDNRKRDAANKIVHELLEHEKVYMQDENLTGWHKGILGRQVQHSILGLIKSKLIRHERVVVLPKNVPTTKYCPNCGNIRREITLSDRIYRCECGYEADRDIHAAKNMILLSSNNTCGTQGIYAFGENVRLHSNIVEQSR